MVSLVESRVRLFVWILIDLLEFLMKRDVAERYIALT